MKTTLLLLLTFATSMTIASASSDFLQVDTLKGKHISLINPGANQFPCRTVLVKGDVLPDGQSSEVWEKIEINIGENQAAIASADFVVTSSEVKVVRAPIIGYLNSGEVQAGVDIVFQGTLNNQTVSGYLDCREDSNTVFVSKREMLSHVEADYKNLIVIKN